MNRTASASTSTHLRTYCRTHRSSNGRRNAQPATREARPRRQAKTARDFVVCGAQEVALGVWIPPKPTCLHAPGFASLPSIYPTPYPTAYPIKQHNQQHNQQQQHPLPYPTPYPISTKEPTKCRSAAGLRRKNSPLGAPYWPY